jgi:hypothetical protein
MPLADRIIDAVGSPTLELQGVSLFAERLMKAERFVFDDEARAAIAQIASSKPTALMTALPLCRLPFERCWFEWPGALDEHRNDTLDEKHVLPRAWGVLLEATDSTLQRFDASFAWDFKPGDIDFSEYGPAVRRVWDGNTINLGTVGLHVDWADWEDWTEIRAANEAEAASALQTTVTTFIPPHSRDMIAALKATQPSEIEPLLASNFEDIKGEMSYVIAALCLLNTKNYTDISSVDLSKQNKARMRRRKRPLLSYSTVKIRLSKQERLAAKAGGMTREEMRRHVVRGHFKIRSSGIYWWRPFIRGSVAAGEVKRTAYEIAA